MPIEEFPDHSACARETTSAGHCAEQAEADAQRSARARAARAKRATERETVMRDMPSLLDIPPPPIGHNGGPPLPRRPGRPTKLTPEMRDEILDRLSNGVPLRMICRQLGMPSRTTVYAWRAMDPEFDRSCQFMRDEGICELGIRLVEEIDELVQTRGSKVARMVYRVRCWQLARLHPQVFGGR